MTDPVCFDVIEDGAMVPVYPRIAARTFEPGTRVLVVAYEQRSQVSHDHFFAVVHDAWMNLPEHLASQWPSPDHLRRYCLVRAGFCDQRSIVCASREEALRWVTEMRLAREFAVVDAADSVVTIYEPLSQSMRAMGKMRFEDSKQKCLDVMAGIIGTDPTTLRQQAGRAA